MTLLSKIVWLDLAWDWRQWMIGAYFHAMFGSDWMMTLNFGPLIIELGSGLEND